MDRELRQAIRRMQVSSPGGAGELFRATYRFCEAGIGERFRRPYMELPLLRFEPLRGAMRGWFRKLDGNLFPNVICIDPTKARHGIDILGILGHELCHFYQGNVLGMDEQEIGFDPHGEEFESGMAILGLPLLDSSRFLRLVSFSGLEAFAETEITTDRIEGQIHD